MKSTADEMRSVVLFICCLASIAFAQEVVVTPRAKAIHQTAIVVDTHADTPQRFLDENYDIGNTDPKDIGHISLDKARAGNLGAEFFSIWVDPSTTGGQYAQHTLDLIDSVYEQAARHPDRMMMAFSVADIERAHKEKKLAALMGIEGGHSIRERHPPAARFLPAGRALHDPELVEHQRVGGLLGRHRRCRRSSITTGLTDFGKQVVTGDEPAGDDGGHLARGRQDVL